MRQSPDLMTHVLEDLFRRRDLRGLNLDGNKDVMMMLYADDLGEGIACDNDFLIELLFFDSISKMIRPVSRLPCK